MRLQWNIRKGGAIAAKHPTDERFVYLVINDGADRWVAIWGGNELGEGSLENCVKACNLDARAALREAKRIQLIREVNKLERQSGGNWRVIKRANLLREQVRKLEQAR